MEDLILQAQKGDVTAFERIYRQHVGRVHALCRRLTGEPNHAEELTQDAFVRAWRHLRTYRPGTRFDAWLLRVALNVVFADRRARARRTRWETPVEEPERWDPPSPKSGPSHRLDLERGIARLPSGARQVFVLHDVEGFRHDEIARHLGITPGTSKAQLHRARRLLREALTK